MESSDRQINSEEKDTANLLRLITGKEVEKAIGRLVGAVVEVPASYLDAWSQQRKDKTAAKSRAVRSLAEAAAKRLTKDPALVQRAIDRWTADIVRKQEAREDIAHRTLEHLNNEILNNDAIKSPPDDFMDFFASVAETASSEALRDLMARVLAGEIRRPGSVSRRAIQLASLLDKEVVDALWTVRPWLMRGETPWIPLIGPLCTSQGQKTIQLLDSVSVIRISEAIGLKFDENSGAAVRREQGDGILLKARKQTGVKFPLLLGGAYVTPLGKELLDLIPENKQITSEEVARGFLENEYIEGTATCEWIEKDEKYQAINVKEVFSLP